MKKVAFHNLGCKVNSYELDGISQMFQKRGYEIVDFAQKADIYIVNTCTVTNIADHKSRQMLGRARAQNPDAVVVAAGCYVQKDPEKAIALDYIDIAIGNNHKSEIVDVVEEYMARRQTDGGGGPVNGQDLRDIKTSGGRTISDLDERCSYEELPVSKTSGHTRAFMKIQDGCDQFCSYCAIPLARGRSRSRELSDIRDEAARLAGNGYREVVITGIHLASYGIESSYRTFAASGKTNTALLTAIETVASVEGISRIRLGSLEPGLVTEEFVRRLAGIEKLCPHFHLSLQSGSDTVLERMKRSYTTAEYEEKVGMLRGCFEHPAITTDVIAGFPGETEEEFEQTRAFLEKTNLYECHIFKYSRRTGTLADRMDGQLTDAVKTKRSAILISDSDSRKHDFTCWYVGKTVEVLTEGTQIIDGKEYSVGYNKEYVRFRFPVTETGQITKILCFEPGCGKICR